MTQKVLSKFKLQELGFTQSDFLNKKAQKYILGGGYDEDGYDDDCIICTIYNSNDMVVEVGSECCKRATVEECQDKDLINQSYPNQGYYAKCEIT